jgi:hypothetical protein
MSQDGNEYQRKCKDVDGIMFWERAQFLLERCQSRLKFRDMDLKGSRRDHGQVTSSYELP